MAIAMVLASCGVRGVPTIAEHNNESLASPNNAVPTSISINATPTLVPTLTPTPDIYQEYGRWDEITHFREELQRTDLPDETRKMLEAKLAQVEFEAEFRATAQVGPTPVRRGRPPETAGDITPPRGILTGYNDIFKRKIDIRNVWQDEVDGIWWQIYAGAIAAEPDKGVLVVRKMEADGTPRSSYETPEQVGAVRIIAEQNQQLTLEAEDGTLFVFDIPSREFVDSALAVTPIPTVATE